MDPILESCCGLDVHKDMIEACIIQGFENPVKLQQQFLTTPAELQRFNEWLAAADCRYVAMESTGVYWRPVYESIESYFGGDCFLLVANAHQMRNLPGRKSDVKDAEWIATLFQHGLLDPSFVLFRNGRSGICGNFPVLTKTPSVNVPAVSTDWKSSCRRMASNFQAF